MLAKPAERVFTQREMTPVPTWAERSRSKADSIPPNSTLTTRLQFEMDSEKITLVSGNIFDGQIKMQLELSARVKILGENGGSLPSWKHCFECEALHQINGIMRNVEVVFYSINQEVYDFPLKGQLLQLWWESKKFACVSKATCKACSVNPAASDE